MLFFGQTVLPYRNNDQFSLDRSSCSARKKNNYPPITSRTGHSPSSSFPSWPPWVRHAQSQTTCPPAAPSSPCRPDWRPLTGSFHSGEIWLLTYTSTESRWAEGRACAIDRGYGVVWSLTLISGHIPELKLQWTFGNGLTKIITDQYVVCLSDWNTNTCHVHGRVNPSLARKPETDNIQGIGRKGMWPRYTSMNTRVVGRSSWGLSVLILTCIWWINFPKGHKKYLANPQQNGPVNSIGSLM